MTIYREGSDREPDPVGGETRVATRKECRRPADGKYRARLVARTHPCLLCSMLGDWPPVRRREADQNGGAHLPPSGFSSGPLPVWSGRREIRGRCQLRAAILLVIAGRVRGPGFRRGAALLVFSIEDAVVIVCPTEGNV